MEASYTQYFQDAFNLDGKVNYIWAHYDATGHHGKSCGLNPSVLGRIRNALAKTINEQVLLRKAILVMLDDDIMDALDHYTTGISYAIGKTLEWLVNQMHRIIISHKEKLPSKSRKFKYPTFLWVKIPNHHIYGHFNSYKKKFNEALDKVTSLYREMETISISEKIWYEDDLSYFVEGRISAVGLSTYWAGICDAFESWDKDHMKSDLKYPRASKESRSESMNTLTPRRTGLVQHDRNQDIMTIHLLAGAFTDRGI